MVTHYDAHSTQIFCFYLLPEVINILACTNAHILFSRRISFLCMIIPLPNLNPEKKARVHIGINVLPRDG